MVNRQQLLALRPLLIDLTVQGQTQQLARPGQAETLAGSPWWSSPGALGDVRRHWQDWLRCRDALEQAESDRLQLEQQRDGELEALLLELEQAALDDPGEIAQLELEQDRLAHGVRLLEGLGLH